MKQTLNKSSYENKTDPLWGSRLLAKKDEKWDKEDRTTFGEMFSYPCLQCAVLIIPLLPWGFWRTHSDILVNILKANERHLVVRDKHKEFRKRSQHQISESSCCSLSWPWRRILHLLPSKGNACYKSNMKVRQIPLFFIQDTMRHSTFIICYWSKIHFPLESHSNEFIICYMCILSIFLPRI